MDSYLENTNPFSVVNGRELFAADVTTRLPLLQRRHLPVSQDRSPTIEETEISNTFSQKPPPLINIWAGMRIGLDEL